MTDDERQRLMDFILEQQAAISAKLDRLSDDHKALLVSHRNGLTLLDRDERVLKLKLRAGEIDVNSNQTREERGNPTAHGRISDREMARLERMAKLLARLDPEFRSTMR